MKTLHHIFTVGLLIIAPFTILANGTFSYTTTGQIPNVTTVGKQYSITYTITSQYSLSRPISTTFKRSTPDFTLTNNCKTQLTAKESCTLVLNFKPKHLGTQSATLVAKDMEFHIINTKIQTTTKKPAHFVFEQNGKSITSLNLKPNATGTIILKNTGDIDITKVKLSNLNKAGFTNIDCPTDTEGKLGPGEYCTFNYQISAMPKENTFTIIASGLNADNTPSNLFVHMSPEYLYMTTQQNVKMCIVDDNDGTLKDCHDTGTGFLGADYAIFSSLHNRAYISDFAGSLSHRQNIYSLCNVRNIDGQLINCQILPISSAAIYTKLIYFNEQGYGIYVYSENSGGLYYCPVDPSTGVLNNHGCTSAIKNPTAAANIAFDKANTRAYIATENSIISCKLNSNTGKLTNNCISAIAKNVKASVFRINNNSTGMYYVDDASNLITYCKINSSTGKLTNCTPTGGNTPKEIYDLALNASNTGMYIAGRTLTYCSIAPQTGKFSNCKKLLDSDSNVMTVHTIIY